MYSIYTDAIQQICMNDEISVIRTDISGYERELRELLVDYFTRANERGKEWFDDEDFGGDVEDIVADDIERLESTTMSEPVRLTP